MNAQAGMLVRRSTVGITKSSVKAEVHAARLLKSLVSSFDWPSIPTQLLFSSVLLLPGTLCVCVCDTTNKIESP